MIVDTGPLVAAANAKDPHGDACRSLLQETPGVLVVPALVVAEAAYLIERELGPQAEAALLRALASHRFEVVAPSQQDLLRAAELEIWPAESGPATDAGRFPALGAGKRPE